MFHVKIYFKMAAKYKLLNVYLCVFKSKDDIKQVSVACDNYSQAAKLAHIVSSCWVNFESYELISISFLNSVSTF